MNDMDATTTFPDKRLIFANSTINSNEHVCKLLDTRSDLCTFFNRAIDKFAIKYPLKTHERVKLQSNLSDVDNSTAAILFRCNTLHGTFISPYNITPIDKTIVCSYTTPYGLFQSRQYLTITLVNVVGQYNVQTVANDLIEILKNEFLSH